VKKHPRHLPASGVGGHDVGISVLVTSSDGTIAENPCAIQKARKKISRYQRRMDRQHRARLPKCFNARGEHIQGVCYWKDRSTRARKNQVKLQKVHAKVARIRKDAIHEASHRAATTYCVNVIEDLDVGGMGSKGHGKRGFNRAVRDASLAEYGRQLAYKSLWCHSTLWVASRWYASSKICSRCHSRRGKLPLSARVFRCEHCGLEINRDLNAAKNLAALAELAFVCLLAQMLTGVPVDWSKLPVRPYGWEPDQHTCSSRGSVRAGGHRADGGERKNARLAKDGDCSFDRKGAEPSTDPGPSQAA